MPIMARKNEHYYSWLLLLVLNWCSMQLLNFHSDGRIWLNVTWYIQLLESWISWDQTGQKIYWNDELFTEHVKYPVYFCQFAFFEKDPWVCFSVQSTQYEQLIAVQCQNATLLRCCSLAFAVLVSRNWFQYWCCFVFFTLISSTPGEYKGSMARHQMQQSPSEV